MEHRENLNSLVITRKTVFQAVDNNLQAFNRRTRELIKVYDGHNSFVTCVQYFNFVLYTGAQDSTIISWNLKTGQPLNKYIGHQGPLTSLTVAEGGPGGSSRDSLFSSSWDGTVRCWSLESGRHKMAYTVGDKPVEVFQVIGGRVYAGSGDTFRVFHAATGRPLFTFKNCPEKIHHAMAFDDELGKLLVGGSTLSVWDLASLSAESRPKVVAEYSITARRGGGGGGGDDDDDDTDSKRQRRRRSSSRSTAANMQPDMESARLASRKSAGSAEAGGGNGDGDDDGSSSDEDNTLLLGGSTDDADHKADMSLEDKYPTKINHIELGDGIFWTGHGNGVVRAWNSKTYELTHDRMRIHRGPITCMLLYKDKLCTGSTDNSVCIWNVEEGRCTHILRGHKHPIACMRKFRGILYTSSFDGDIRTWDLNRNMVYTGLYKGSAARIHSLYQDGGDRLWMANSIGHIVLWDTALATMLLEVKAFDMPCSRVIADGDRVLVSAGDLVNVFSYQSLKAQEDAEKDDDLYLMRPKNYEQLAFAGQITDMVWFDTDVVVVATDIDIHVLNVSTNHTRCFNQIAQGAHAMNGAISVARATNELVSVSATSKNMCFWSVNDGKLRRSVNMEGEASCVCVGSFSPNILHGRRFWNRGIRIGSAAVVDVVCVAVGDPDDAAQLPQTARVYKLPDMDVLWNFEFHTNTITDMVVNGGWLYCASRDESVSVWNLQRGELYHVIRDHDQSVHALALNYRDNVLYHSSYQLIGTDLNLLTRWGVNIKYHVACGRGGLFGTPVEEEEIALERQRIKRMETRQDMVIQDLKSPGGNNPHRLTIQRASYAHRESEQYTGDPEIDVSAPSATTDIREIDSKWSMHKKVANAFFNMVVLGYLMFAIEILQLASFAFTIGMGMRGFSSKVLQYDFDRDSYFDDMRGWVKFLQFLQTLHFAGDFRVKVFLASLAVFALWAVLVAQEGLEWRRYLFPTNRFVRRMWRFARFIVKWMCVPVFMPVFQTFALAFSCSNVDVGWVWDVDPDIKCWEGAHVGYVIASSFLIVAYVLPVLRLVRAGTRLDNIEVEGNPLDWRQDKQEVNHVHIFSPASTVPDLVQVFAKMGLVVAAMTLTNHPRTQVVLSTLMIFIVVACHCIWIPFFSWRMTCVRVACMVGVFWCYVSACVGAYHDDEIDDVAELLLFMLIWVVPISFYVPVLLEDSFYWYKRPVPRNYTNEGRMVRHGRMSMKMSKEYNERVDEFSNLLQPLEASRLGLTTRGSISTNALPPTHSKTIQHSRQQTSNVQLAAFPSSGAMPAASKASLEGDNDNDTFAQV